MPEALPDFLLQRSWAPPVAGGVLIGVSGGPDSTLLAWFLRRLGPERRLHLWSARHGFLPADAESRHRRVLAELACHLELPLHLSELPTPASWRPGDPIDEARARELRYRAMLEAARRLDLPVLAVAHHADDQQETRLLHLLRGGTLKALRGMRTQRLQGERWLWRPLLDLPRATLWSLLERIPLPTVADPSNADPRMRRNRVRNGVLPQLKGARDPLLQRLPRWGRIAGRALERIESVSRSRLDGARSKTILRDALVLRRDRLPLTTPSAAHYLLEELERRLRVPMTVAGRDRALRVMLGREQTRGLVFGGLELASTESLLLVRSRGRPASRHTVSTSPNRWQRGRASDGWAVRWRMEPGPSHSAQPAGVPTILLRSPRPGDRLRVPTRGTRRLVDLFREHGISRWERESWPVLATTDEVIGLPGIVEGARPLPGPAEALSHSLVLESRGLAPIVQERRDLAAPLPTREIRDQR